MTIPAKNNAPEISQGQENPAPNGLPGLKSAIDRKKLQAQLELTPEEKKQLAVCATVLGLSLLFAPAGESEPKALLGKPKPIPENERPKEPPPPPKEEPKDEISLRLIIQKEEGPDFKKTWPLFQALGKKKGWKAAFYSYCVHRNLNVNIGDGKMTGKRYHSAIEVRNFEGQKREAVTFSCVGSTLSALANLPFKAIRGGNAEKYLSDYDWAGKDAFTHFIPDIVGKNSSRYVKVDDFDPDHIDAAVPPGTLAVGEYAIAAFYNHVFLIYRDFDGTVKMRHSGANIDENGQSRGGESRLNETTLSGYGRYHQRRYSKEIAQKLMEKGKSQEESQKAGRSITRQFIFLPLTELISAGEMAGQDKIDRYYKEKMAAA
ncbi:hypothetical protein JXA05_01855 [Candidatus Peregrinibacteria bacterium]|nr:hypothetical protein [Candidatus Peregrinibacteria bacterium]